ACNPGIVVHHGIGNQLTGTAVDRLYVATQGWEETRECDVGWDVSFKQPAICVVRGTGSVVREGVVDSGPAAIAAFVRSRAPGAIRVGLETGPTSTWLWTKLKQLALPVICIAATPERYSRCRSIRVTA